MGEHVFISYAREDGPYVVRLAEELERHGFKVWFDRRIHHGERWPPALKRAVRDCAALIVIMTPDAEASEWVRKELDLALDDRKPVFPLLLKGKVFQSLGEIQCADVKGERMPDESFFDDLTRVPGAKTSEEQLLHKNRSEFEEVLRRSSSEDVFRKIAIDSGLIDDPEEAESWKEGLREPKKG